MRVRWIVIASFLCSILASIQGQQEQRFVVLPARVAGSVASQGSWQPTKADIDGLEANLSKVSALKAEGWPSTIRIDHPQQYFRQYVAILRGGQRRIYVNAFCDEQLRSEWRDRLVVVNDGATCFWQALYDPTIKKFSNLRINARG
jgi:hypothetical protein